MLLRLIGRVEVVEKKQADTDQEMEYFRKHLKKLEG
jgi:hypothetical protein